MDGKGFRLLCRDGPGSRPQAGQHLAAGVLETIQKPYDFNDLVAKVREIIGPPQKEDEDPQLF